MRKKTHRVIRHLVTPSVKVSKPLSWHLTHREETKAYHKIEYQAPRENVRKNNGGRAVLEDNGSSF